MSAHGGRITRLQQYMAKTKKKTKSKTKTKTTKTKKKAVAKKSAVAVGKPLPDISLPATGGKEVALHELHGKRVVLYFYPKDATPGCTIEGRDFSRLYDDFKAAGAEVYGISRDSMKSHEKFKEKESYCIDLLSDEDEKLCKMFGVIKMKNMYGRQVRGIERSTFVVDQDGRLVKEWRGVRVPGHAEEVLDYIRSL
jgi:peroxiredoxin Q/BCP